MSSVATVNMFEQHPVRHVMSDAVDEPIWIARDVCDVVGISKYRDAVAQLDPDERVSVAVDTPGGTQQMAGVTEAGVWSLMLISRSPVVKSFKRWLTHTVLPEIRRTGGYGNVVELPGPRQLAQMVIEAEDRADREAAARREAEARAKELEAPASAWKHLASSEGDYEVADAAKVLSRDPKIKIGRDRLFSFMAAEGWIFRNRHTARWKVYQPQVDNGRLTEKFGKPFLHDPSGEMRLGDPTIRVTPKGMAELHKRLGGSGQLALVAAS